METGSGSISCLNIWSMAYDEEKLIQFSQCKNHGYIFHLDSYSGTAHGAVEVEDYFGTGEFKIVG